MHIQYPTGNLSTCVEGVSCCNKTIQWPSGTFFCSNWNLIVSTRKATDQHHKQTLPKILECVCIPAWGLNTKNLQRETIFQISSFAKGQPSKQQSKQKWQDLELR